jgi:outer membrane immunogenic protein
MRAASIAALAPVVAMACTLALPQAAQAADYLRGSQIEQPVEAPSMFGGGRFDWSGFYFGGGRGHQRDQVQAGRRPARPGEFRLPQHRPRRRA